MKILVINLMRLGDIIQSGVLLKELKKAHPHAELHLLVNSAFARAAQMVTYDKLHILNYELIYHILKEEKRALPYVFTYLRDFLSKLREENFDRVINITPSNIGSIIASFCYPGEIYGSYVDKKGIWVIKNPWARYFYTTCKIRNCNSINIVDLFLKIGGIKKTEGGLDIKRKKKNRPPYMVAFHLGASKKNRCWPPENFAKLAKILRNDLEVNFLILGTASEKILLERFLKHFPFKCENLLGKTDLKTLTEILSRIDLLVCNDSGPMHIACGVGTRVISVFLATANPYETGPYGTGHFVIEPDISCHPCDHSVKCKDYHCHYVVTPDAVAVLARHALTGEPFSANFKNVKVFCSQFAKDGLLELFPLTPLNWSIDRFVMLLWRVFLPAYLDRGNVEKQMIDKIEQYFGKDIIRERHLEIKEQIDILNELNFFARNGEYYCEKIIQDLETENFLLVSNWVRLLSEIDDYIKTWGHRYPAWKGLTQIFLLEKLSIEEGNIKEMARKNKQCYLRLKEQTMGFIDLIKDCLKEVYHDCYCEWKENRCVSCRR